jgi:holo-[acyl-carrier protein] synthase
MATVGVGVDLVEVSRVERMIAERGAHIFERLLTPAERTYCEQMARPAEHVAVRLAAKEAVYKALQGSDEARKIGWRDTEVVRATDGRPEAVLAGRAAARARELGVRRVLLSLSHTHTTAIAVAVLETA